MESSTLIIIAGDESYQTNEKILARWRKIK